jgi:hypothetical protein
MRNNKKFFHSYFTWMAAAVAAIWLILTIATNMPLVGHIAFVLLAAWLFELYSAAQLKNAG